MRPPPVSSAYLAVSPAPKTSPPNAATTLPSKANQSFKEYAREVCRPLRLAEKGAELKWTYS